MFKIRKETKQTLIVTIENRIGSATPVVARYHVETTRYCFTFKTVYDLYSFIENKYAELGYVISYNDKR